MSFNHINRRTHLYLAMFLLPWFFMYGLSSVPFSHSFNEYYDDGIPAWSERFSRPYHRVIPDDADVQAVAGQIIADAGMEGPAWVARPNPNRFIVTTFRFLSTTRLVYLIDEGRLVAEDRRFRWDHFLTGMHARGGFQHDSILHDTWAVVVDIVCVAMIVWMATGLIMWWQLSRTRFWGGVALGGGLLVFTGFLLML